MSGTELVTRPGWLTLRRKTDRKQVDAGLLAHLAQLAGLDAAR